MLLNINSGINQQPLASSTLGLNEAKIQEKWPLFWQHIYFGYKLLPIACFQKLVLLLICIFYVLSTNYNEDHVYKHFEKGRHNHF